MPFGGVTQRSKSCITCDNSGPYYPDMMNSDCVDHCLGA